MLIMYVDYLLCVIEHSFKTECYGKNARAGPLSPTCIT